MFDNWDHTIQTGSDTEYALVVLALCIGFAYSVARCLFRVSPRSTVCVAVSKASRLKSVVSISLGVIQFASSISPPPVALRI